MEIIISKSYFIEDFENSMRHSSASRLRKLSSWILNKGWRSSYHGRALENARIDPKSLASSETAVFMGIDSDDYSRLILEDLLNIEAWSGIGVAYNGIPNRISYIISPRPYEI
jgi:6-methylsalicylic acid synthase